MIFFGSSETVSAKQKKLSSRDREETGKEFHLPAGTRKG